MRKRRRAGEARKRGERRERKRWPRGEEMLKNRVRHEKRVGGGGVKTEGGDKLEVLRKRKGKR